MRRRDLLAGALGLSVPLALPLVLPLAGAGCAGSSPPVRPPAATGGRPLRPRVVIVGGGLAGLAAALELTGRGVSVTVLEAQDRPGGRIQTVRSPLTEGLHVEAGAKHVVGDPDLLALMKSVGIEPAPRPRRKGPPLAQIAHLGDARRLFPVSLSAAKRSAIGAVGATSVTRIWIETSERPWLGRGESATADTDLAIGRIQDEIEGLEGPRGILAAYLSGAKARHLGALAEAPPSPRRSRISSASTPERRRASSSARRRSGTTIPSPVELPHLTPPGVHARRAGVGEAGGAGDRGGGRLKV